ncbi:BQ5605_C019g09007 [Microbotryum silenes-dioicae]|uniref:BQ5605_C019g09007 protein n=1 Tax=Microbotryum silenes-dioicae TaxID=796604 RepID=A0A2X0LWA0_9BASI|nr:BQ5605_C019g09007 [Microbotryum silenes-dioicae]
MQALAHGGVASASSSMSVGSGSGNGNMNRMLDHHRHGHHHAQDDDDKSPHRRALKKQRQANDAAGLSRSSGQGAPATGMPTPGEASTSKAVSGVVDPIEAAEIKPHVCDWPGCGKAFSRPDHLNRHKLNHRPATIYKCSKPGCPKTFVRNDLLIRHEGRHERKGQTGASGALSRNSVTSARKLQSSGTIPSEIPFLRSRVPSFGSASSASVDGVSPGAASSGSTPHPQASASASTRSPGRAGSYPHLAGLTPVGESAMPNHHEHRNSAMFNLQQHLYGPLSHAMGSAAAGPNNPPAYNPFTDPNPNPMPPPPITSFSGNAFSPPSGHPAANQLNHHQNEGAPNPAGGVYGPGAVPNDAPTPLFDSFNSDAPGPQSSMPGFEEPLNFIQQSYGVPFVSASEYSWLFDPTGGFDIQFARSRPVSPGHELLAFNGPGSVPGGQTSNSNGTGRTPGSGMSPEDLQEVTRGLGLHAQVQNGGYGRIATEWESINRVNSPGQRQNAPESTPQSAVEEVKPTPPPVIAPSPRTDPSPMPIVSIAIRAAVQWRPRLTTFVEQTSDSESATFPAPSNSAARGNVDRSTYIDERTRLKVIDYLEIEGKPLRNDPRMSRAAMVQYLEDFWLRIHETQVPGIHRASFKTNRTKTPLLLSMLLLGCYFGPLESQQLAVKLHSFFRGKVICSAEFKPRTELWLHQTILLISVFGKLCSTRLHHEMAHIFWSSCVTLGRRSAIFSQRAPAVMPKGKENDVEARWAAWIEEESLKRTALIIFALDVEHASLFRHSPALSAFQIQVQLPCDEDEWEATTAQEWAILHAQARAPAPFISALKASLMAGHSPPVLNSFSRIAILHGLLSVAQDLQWRDHVIGLSQSERAHNWRDMISSSYNSWKSRLDTCLAGVTAPTTQLLRASISLYAVAHITLSIDIHELQIYAGAESALGLLVSTAVFHATEARIRMWSSTKDARAASWHAAFFLRDSMQHYEHAKEDLAGCLHHRWCVYIATLTLYCYGRATSGRPGPRTADYKGSALRFLDSLCCDSPESLLLIRGKNNVLDLCQMIQEYIETSRWEIAQEGARILRRLLTNSCPGPPNKGSLAG